MGGGTGTGGLGNNARRAKLVELVNNDFSPLYKFSHDSIHFRDSPKKEGSDLIYMTFRQGPRNANDIKHEAMKAFERDYKDILNFRSSIEEQEEMKSYYEERLENLKAKNHYFQKPGLIPNIITGGFGAMSINSFLQGHYCAGFGLGVAAIISGGAIEAIRRTNKKWNKQDLDSINQNIEFYDNFKRNIENANVYVSPVEEAREVYDKIEKGKGDLDSKYINTKEINRELKEAYKIR